jgi:ribulose-phosphate 3-epimerase
MEGKMREIGSIGDKKGVAICPAVIGAAQIEIGRFVALAEEGGADAIHLDVMDGSFVPTITFGQACVAEVRRHTDLLLDVHLLVANPEDHIKSFIAAGADVITVHVEACRNACGLLESIHQLGANAGIALVPSTPISAIEELVHYVDVMVVMTANPGTSAFLPATVGKIQRIRALVDRGGRDFVPITADGGVKSQNVPELAAAGVRWFVSASGVFGGGPGEIARNIAALRAAAGSRVGIAGGGQERATKSA